MAYKEDKTLTQIKTRLMETFKAKKIYLFGSRARGKARKDSDYDLLVIVEKSKLSYPERNVKARMALSELEIPVDVFVVTQKEFDEMKDELSSIPETALFEGRELNLG
jgi:uncharacterized protein